jgi:GTPase Era involved in 16S rRNA processing
MKLYNLPFNEEKISDNTFIRTFKQETVSEEFIWHKDKESRIISPIGVTDWKFQLDNQLPIEIKEEIYIPKEVYHRIIKGSGDLKIKLIKLYES